MDDFLVPRWPVPSRVRAVITTRKGGVSTGPYASLNLGDHVGDDSRAVKQNREILKQRLALPESPHWMNQIHGCTISRCEVGDSIPEADASTTDVPGRVCAVLTADCLPVLLCNRSGTRVAAVHGGWRGLAAGVLERAVDCFAEPGDQLLAWFGPAIGPAQFEVGNEVRECFLDRHLINENSFIAARPGHWLADIYQLAKNQLVSLGVGFVGGGEYCTVTDKELFYSYRRDGVTGRMASLIWIDPA